MLDEKKQKMPINPNYQVALLEEITIYTNDETELPLRKIINTLFLTHGEEIPITVKDSPVKIKDFFRSIAPNYDETRVYVSDMQKVIKWYDVLIKNAPRITEEENAKIEEEAKQKASAEAETAKK